MCLGALVGAGVPLDYLIENLAKLGISSEYRLRSELVIRQGQQATKVHVEVLTEAVSPENVVAAEHHHHEHHHHDREHHHHPPIPPPTTHPLPLPHHRHLPEIEQMIRSAGLPTKAQTWSLQVFRQLAVAEGAVHGIAPEQVHFHEVGAVDAIADIVGTCLGLDWLGIDQLYCSALPTGGGTVRAAHGILPVPVPAVLKLWELRQVPVYSNGIDRELCTPTGVAIATTLATNFGAPPPMNIQQIGLGAGSRELPIPNILRLWIGTAVATPPSNREILEPDLDTIAVLETQIDDLNPQAIGYTLEALFAAGALDAFTQPISMKKSRSGVLLTVICPPEKQSACEAAIFRETSTLGIRHRLQQRTILPREIQVVATDYGKIRIKVAWNGQTQDKIATNVQPEYEDCAAIARQHNIPWREVHYAALSNWYRQQENR
jgi:uncharacterized protein (TIGR00299 family) protein